MDEIFEMDEKLKWMNTTCLQPKIMCQSKFYMFTIEMYVSIET
jgi:hypothetical protein